jgi:hypothetical protein
MEGMFGVGGNVLWDEVALAALRSNVVLMTVGGVLCTPVFRILKQRIRPNAFFDVVHVLVLVSLLIVSVASLVSSSYNPFIYFNF